MPQFKHTITRLLRFPPKSRRPLPQHGKATIGGDTVIPRKEYYCLRGRGKLVFKSTLPAPLDTDVDEIEVGENEEIEIDVQDAEVDDTFTSETFPSDLARKTHMEMMIRDLYVALSDDDAEIAALRTRHCERFTHVIRITFEPPSNGTLAPSCWSMDQISPSDAPCELRLTCPAFSRHPGEHHCALTTQQLVLARKYIASLLPYRDDGQVQHGIKIPVSVDDCQEARLLIVGPTDRSVDVMAILIGYLTFLTGASAPKLLRSVQNLDFVHPRWKDCALEHAAYIATTP